MKILVATDGSAPAGVGLRLVASLAWPAGSVARIVTAVDTGTAIFGGPWPTVAITQAASVEAALREDGRRVLDQAASSLSSAGLAVETALLDGRAADAIVAEAERWGADLLVVGSRGHGMIDTMLLGSVTSEILDVAHLPVLVARTDRLAGAVLAWDGSDTAARAARILATWPVLHHLQVHVVSVAETPTPWWAGSMEAGGPEMMQAILDTSDAIRAEQQRLNQEKVADLARQGIDATGETRLGDAAREVLSAASERDADLIVIGTHGRSGLARLTLGSVARNVVSHAECSVLVVRGGEGRVAGAAG